MRECPENTGCKFMEQMVSKCMVKQSLYANSPMSRIVPPGRIGKDPHLNPGEQVPFCGDNSELDGVKNLT